MLTLQQVEGLAREAHEGQFDKIGVPYFEHVRAVADGLAPFGEHLEMAGLLHDVIEDTDWTDATLARAGVPEEVIAVVLAVTNVPGGKYLDKVEVITRSREATLVKIADNAHNSRKDRQAHLSPEERERLAKKYLPARQMLWAAVDSEEVRTIVSIVNPDLLAGARTVLVPAS